MHVPRVLSQDQVRDIRRRLGAAGWVDGRVTAGHQSVMVKHNLQLRDGDPLARELGAMVLAALQDSPFFFSAALPSRIFPPLFNCYQAGHGFGDHIDNAIRYDRSVQPSQAVRTDLSVTLFLSEPEEYDGGDLVIDSPAGTHRVKLPAGDLVLYSATSRHHVTPVTRGSRWASFFWIQSMVRDEAARAMLFELDNAIQGLRQRIGDSEEVVSLTGLYHNLVRRWAEA